MQEHGVQEHADSIWLMWFLGRDMKKMQMLNLISGSLVGGYVFTWGVTALGIAGLVALGVDFHEAETGMLLLGFLVFLTAFIWSFTNGKMMRVWGILAGGGALMISLAWWIQTTLLRGV
jgi:hypothetical protein